VVKPKRGNTGIGPTGGSTAGPEGWSSSARPLTPEEMAQAVPIPLPMPTPVPIPNAPPTSGDAKAAGAHVGKGQTKAGGRPEAEGR
jgi:hypothetical protein